MESRLNLVRVMLLAAHHVQLSANPVAAGWNGRHTKAHALFAVTAFAVQEKHASSFQMEAWHCHQAKPLQTAAFQEAAPCCPQMLRADIWRYLLVARNWPAALETSAVLVASAQAPPVPQGALQVPMSNAPQLTAQGRWLGQEP